MLLRSGSLSTWQVGEDGKTRLFTERFRREGTTEVSSTDAGVPFFTSWVIGHLPSSLDFCARSLRIPMNQSLGLYISIYIYICNYIYNISRVWGNFLAWPSLGG